MLTVSIILYLRQRFGFVSLVKYWFNSSFLDVLHRLVSKYTEMCKFVCVILRSNHTG